MTELICKEHFEVHFIIIIQKIDNNYCLFVFKIQNGSLFSDIFIGPRVHSLLYFGWLS